MKWLGDVFFVIFWTVIAWGFVLAGNDLLRKQLGQWKGEDCNGC